MVTKEVIKSTQFFDGRLFAVVGSQRNLLAECTPVINIYRQNNPVPILVRTSYALKTYHIAIVLCGQPDFAPGIDYDFVGKVNRFDLTAKTMLKGNFIREFAFNNLYPENIDPRGEWAFSFESPAELIDELLAL